MEFFCLIFAGGIVVAIFVFWNNNQQNEIWTEAAKELRLHYDKNGFSSRAISGERAQMHVTISTRTTKTNNTNTKYTSYHIGFRKPIGLSLNLKSQHNNRHSLKEDIVVGDPVFDSKFIVSGGDENAIRKYLDPDRRRLLVRLAKQFDDYEITPTAIHVAKRGNPANSEILIHAVHLLAKTADQFGVYETEDAPVPPPLPDRKVEITPDTAIELEPVVISEPTIEDVEIQIASMAEQLDSAEPAIEDATAREDVEVPAAQISGVEPVLEETSPVPTPEPVAIENDAPTPKTPIVDDDFEQLCSELFDSGLNRFETGLAFNDELKGLQKSGHGILKRVEKFSSDLVFGRGPGLLAHVDVLTLDGGKNASVVLEFSTEENFATLREKIGETIHFSGTLVKCDPFTNRIFVAR